MIWNISVAILIMLTGWIILLVFRLNQKSGITWLISVLISLTAFLGWGVLGVLQPKPLLLDFAQAPFGLPASLSFGVDSVSRGMGLLLLSAQLFILISWMVRLEQEKIFYRIKNLFLLTAFSLLLVSAENVFTWLVMMILIDAMDLIHHYREINWINAPERMLAATLIRFAGSYVFLLGWMLSIQLSSATVFSEELLLVGMLIRLWGAFKLSVKTDIKPNLQRSHEETYLIALPSLVYFVRYPLQGPLSGGTLLLRTLAVLIMVYELVQWWRAENRRESFIAFLRFQVLFVLLLLLQVDASGGVALLLIFFMATFSLYFRPFPHRFIFWMAIPLFILWSGIPFLPTASIWTLRQPGPYWLYLFYAGFLIGYPQQFSRQEPESTSLERWMKVLYPLGYLPFIGTFIYLALLNDLPLIWGQPLLSVVLALFVVLVYGFAWLRQRGVIKSTESLQWIAPFFNLLWTRLIRILHGNWFSKILRFSLQIIQQVVLFFNRILEGDGGLIWAIVMLILFLSIVRT